MAVHRVSDQIVVWITGEPGMAASRIAFSIRSTDREGRSIQEIYTVDSDGENLQRVTSYGDLTLGPAWSPDGRKLAFTSYKNGTPRLYELDLVTRQDRELPIQRSGDVFSPAYHPDGERLAFAVAGRGQSGIFSLDVSQDCCLVHMSGGRYNDLSPTFSPDGRQMAFNSNRLGTATPQIYVMPTSGGDAELISPYQYGQGGYYTSPDWSPTADRVAFHGRIRRGRYQILVAEVADRGRRLRQLTWEGNNEDPSWAPDGRHLVFVGERSWGYGLFVVDGASGKIRPLVTGRNVRIPEWSGALGSDAGGALRTGGF
jgi:TolB protein